MGISARWITLSFSIVMAATVTLLYYKYGVLTPEQIYTVSGVITGLTATLLGFIITVAALIFALIDRTLVKNLRATGHYDVLMRDATFCCLLLLISCVVSLACLIFPTESVRNAFLTLLFFLSISFVYVFQSGRRFAMVLRAI